MLDKFFKNKKTVEIKNTNTSARYNALKKDDYIKCKECGEILYKNDLRENQNQCLECGYLFRLSPRQRISDLVDKDSFNELFSDISSSNPLDFDGYDKKIEKYKNKSGEKTAILTGIGEINNKSVAIGCMNPFFMMGSMGSALGEKLTLLVEKATEKGLPLIIFCASGGARMQEGVFSLMQMAKISSALKKHSKSGNLYLSILTDPTTGGVSASFAMLGDIIIAEPDALIGFAGPRVIKQTIKKELPEGFQTSEYLLDHGFVDMIEKRDKMRNTLIRILKMHRVDNNE